MKFTAILTAFAGSLVLTGATYQVIPEGATCRILRDGKPFISTIGNPITGSKAGPYKYKVDKQTLKDGSVVWNFTSTDPRLNCRMEVALLKGGSELEITASTSRPAKTDMRTKPQPLLGFKLAPEFYRDAEYDGLMDNTRVWNRKKGSLTDFSKFPFRKYWRYLTLRKGDDSVIFDINPIGPGDFESNSGVGICRGIAWIQADEKGMEIRWPNTIYSFGGMVAAKMRIKDGRFEDYHNDHALKTFMYTDPLKAQYQLCFGAKKYGKKYTSADGKAFDAKRGWGWVGAMPDKTVTTGAGAYYSHQAGKNGHYRFSGLKDGLHLITVGAGNPTGTPNRFSVTVNGKKLLSGTTIAKDRFLTATLPLWIDHGTADIKLDGDYIVSSICSQFLLSNREDFQCRRGFWVTDGHEPSALFTNANYRPYATEFKPSVKETVLPPHGRETAGKYHDWQAPRIPVDFDDPKNYWLFDARIERVGNNTASFEEMEDPKVMAAILDDAVKKGRNTIMFSGMHSRHTYRNSEDRTIRYFKRFCDEAHKRGLKVINHHDTTLLWNSEGGFRLLAETLDGVNRSTASQLPGVQYCILSPYFRKQCMDYLRRLVEAGADALQLDELTFCNHAGSCPACREEFHKETGWYLPVDETNSCFRSYDNDLYRAFSNWKREKSAEWKTNIKREFRKINPNLALPGYGAFHLVLSPWGLWAWNSNLMKTGRGTSLMGKECQSPNVIANARMFVASQKFYNYFRFAFGIPIYTWCSTQDWKTSYFAFSTCLMNAQLPLDYGGGFEDKSPGAMDFLPFEQSPDVMNRRLCREMAQTGILYSFGSVCNDQTEKMPPGTFGFSQTLEEIHMPYVFLGDDGINSDLLKRLKVLYVGAAACLSDGQIEAIRDFVRNGGTVLLSGRAGTRDEFGKWRKQWPFEDMLGFTVRPKMKKVVAITDGTSEYPLQGRDLKCVKTVPAATGKSLFQLKMKSGELVPGVIGKKVGKGRIFFFPARLEELFYCPDVSWGKVSEFDYDAKLAAFYRGILGKIIGNTSLLKTDAPEKVFMTLYREKDQVLVHLLNGLASGHSKGDQVPNTFKKAPFPALTRDITITVPAFGKNEIYAVSPDFAGRKKLSGEYHADGTVTVTLPKELLKGYTLIRIR